MLHIADHFQRKFSQTRWIANRRREGLHPVNEMNRFYVLVCCFFCSICVSVVYAFDLFTTQFQNEFHLSAGDLSTISTVGLVFCYFTIPYSAIYESMGPFILFYICICTSFIGGLGLILTFHHHIRGTTAILSVFYALLNICSGLTDVGYVTTLFEIFPRNRGPVVCIAKVMTGLGASVLACLSDTIFRNNIVAFIIFLMALCMFVGVWASVTIVLPPYFMNWWRRRGKSREEIVALQCLAHEYEHKNVPFRRLIVGYTVVGILIVFFTIETPVVAYVKTTKEAQIAIGIITILFTLCIFLMLLPSKYLGGLDDKYDWSMFDRRVQRRLAELYSQDNGPVNGAALEPIHNFSSSDKMKAGNALALFNPEELVSPTSKFYSAAPGEVVNSHEMQVNDPNALIDEGEFAQTQTSIQRTQHTDQQLSQLLNGESPDANAEEKPEEEEYCPQDPRYDGSCWDYLRSVDLWLIMLLFVCYGCTGVLVMYNASTIYVAVSGHERSSTVSSLYTAFLGVGSALGRIAFGLFEAYVQHQPADNRRFVITITLPLSPLFAAISAVIILFVPGDALILPYLLAYFEEGVFAGVNALIFPCMFAKHHNFLYNLSFLVQCITTICFNRLMFGMYVDKQHKRLGLSRDVDCNQKVCIQTPMIVSACLGFVGIFVAIAIHIRYARFVRRERQKEAEMQAFLKEQEYENKQKNVIVSSDNSQSEK